jgi:hypothetical protein
MYDYQNQLSNLKQAFSQSQQKKSAPKSAMSSIGRLIHTMRQVNRLNVSFAELYPYRPDNDPITEKLCYHFYKQMHLSVLNFTQSVNLVSQSSASEFLNMQSASSISDRFLVLLADCDRYFAEFGQVETDCKALVKYAPDNKSSDKPNTGITGKKTPNVVNIVRLPRVNHLTVGNNNINTNQQQVSKSIVTTKTIFDKNSKYSETNAR